MRRNGNTVVKRRIVHIDEAKCDGCGQCVPECAEGAIRIVDDKAKLVSDSLCDGLGTCLGHCPQGAITIEQRESAPFDEDAVRSHASQPPHPDAPMSGCPSARLLDLSPPAAAAGGPATAPSATPSALGHWPIQLHLLPPTAPFLKEADLLICAPCVPVAMPDFHARLLAGRAVAIACPKLDDQTGYVERLAAMFAGAGLKSVTVARMSVPCCGGLLHLVHRARRLSGSALPVTDVVIGHDGSISETAGEVEPPTRAPCHEMR